MSFPPIDSIFSRLVPLGLGLGEVEIEIIAVYDCPSRTPPCKPPFRAQNTFRGITLTQTELEMNRKIHGIDQ